MADAARDILELVEAEYRQWEERLADLQQRPETITREEVWKLIYELREANSRIPAGFALVMFDKPNLFGIRRLVNDACRLVEKFASKQPLSLETRHEFVNFLNDAMRYFQDALDRLPLAMRPYPYPPDP